MIRWRRLEIDRKKLRIERGNVSVQFKRVRGGRRCIRFDLLCHLMLSAPSTRMHLFDVIYSHDAVGGPTDLRIIDVTINQMSRAMRSLGLVLRRNKEWPYRHLVEAV